MRVLIFGTSYIEGQHARYLFTLWEKLTTRLNTVDMMVVDSASPDMPPPSQRVLQLDDNVGHLEKTGRDGWGRAFVAGLRTAINEGYDYAVHIECDVLLARPVMSVIERMVDHGIKYACPMATPYSMIETAVCFMDVGWMREVDFIGRYDWECVRPPELPENRVRGIVGDGCWCLPWAGVRNDLMAFNAGNLREKFPGGMDWITHCRDANVYREFLRMNGHGDLA